MRNIWTRNGETVVRRRQGSELGCPYLTAVGTNGREYTCLIGRAVNESWQAVRVLWPR
jgi:hypothetical protein